MDIYIIYFIIVSSILALIFACIWGITPFISVMYGDMIKRGLKNREIRARMAMTDEERGVVMNFEMAWGNYRNMCRMSNIANIRKDEFKEYYDAGKNAREIFIELHEAKVKRTIDSLASRIGYTVELKKNT